MTCIATALVYLLMLSMLPGPNHHSRRVDSSRPRQPADPITGAKLNWETYLWRRTEAFQEHAKRRR